MLQDFLSNLSGWLLLLLVHQVSTQNASRNLDSQSPLTHGTFLDTGGTFFLSWVSNDTHVVVEISARTLGWVAFGISPNGGMNQSDVLLGWVDDGNGATTVQDRWNTVDDSFGVHLLLDTQQDWILLAGAQNATHTTIRAVRAVDTCDVQDRPFTQNTLHIIWSFHTHDPVNPNTITKHTQRGSRSILFYSPSLWLNRTVILTQQPNLQEMDIRMAFDPDVGVSIPSNLATYYYCKLIRLATIDRKYHIIGINPLIDIGNEGLVHHILVYLCTSKVTAATRPLEYNCNHEQHDDAIDSITASCQTVMAAWAIGGNDIIFPDEAGLPLNPELSGRFVLLEIHYNNPNPPPLPRFDRSGIKFVMTETLRQFDVATLNTGVMDFNYLLTVPPNASDFVVFGRCESNCSQTMFPPEGIKVFQALLHTHLQGRKVFLRHIRNGTELEPIASDDTYDFAYQETRVLNPPRQVLPGDQLIVECHYAGKSVPTFGGFGTQDEMCLVYATYYPATNMTGCGSIANYKEFQQMAGYMPDISGTQSGSASSPDVAAKSYLNNQYAWNANSSDLFQSFYKTSDYTAICGANEQSLILHAVQPRDYAIYASPSQCQIPSQQLNQSEPIMQAVTSAPSSTAGPASSAQQQQGVSSSRPPSDKSLTAKASRLSLTLGFCLTMAVAALV